MVHHGWCIIHLVKSGPKVTSADNMSSKWESSGDVHDVSNGQTIGSTMGAVGEKEWSLGHNCISTKNDAEKHLQ